MSAPHHPPLTAIERQELQAQSLALGVIETQIKQLKDLRHYQNRLGKPVSKNLNVVIKFLKAFKEEVAQGRYDRAAILAMLKAPIIETDGSTPR